MSNSIFFRPLSWSVIRTNRPSIQIFGYTNKGSSIYVRLNQLSTYILRFNKFLDSESLTSLNDMFVPKFINNNDRKAIIRSETITMDNEIPELDKLSVNPCGELESLWKARNLKPYGVIKVSNYKPIGKKYTTCDIEITTSEEYLHDSDLNIDIEGKILFWDIETYSSVNEAFPDMNNPNDIIFMISAILKDGEKNTSYVIVKSDYNYYIDDTVNIIRVNNEKDLLQTFSALIKFINPDKFVYYNGDTFDLPYLIARMKYHNIDFKGISKIINLHPTVYERKIYTPKFPMQKVLSLSFPGLEVWDILRFYRLFYPYYSNYKLDTIAINFLGEGKTGLTIDEMMTAVRLDDETLMDKVVNYSYIDSLRMAELWDATNIQSTIEPVCNNLMISSDTLLHDSANNIIKKAIYNIDEYSIDGFKIGKSENFTVKRDQGWYTNVYIYEFSQIYRQIMLDVEDDVINELAKRLFGAPPVLLETGFYCMTKGYKTRKEILKRKIAEIIEEYDVISINSLQLLSSKKISNKYLNLIDSHEVYIAVADSSYISLTRDYFEFVGLASLCKPKFILAKEMLQNYIKHKKDNLQYSLPSLEYMDENTLDKLILQEKIDLSKDYKENTLKYRLAKQYLLSSDGDIVKLKYLQTVEGPKILPTNIDINKKWYNDALLEYKLKLDKIID